MAAWDRCAVLQSALDLVPTAAAGRGVVVECRFGPYVAAWRPSGEVARRWVQGARAGCQSHGQAHAWSGGSTPLRRGRCGAQPQALADVVGRGFEEVTLTAPARAGRPWVLDVPPPAG